MQQQKPTPSSLLYKRNRSALYAGVAVVVLIAILSSLITLTYLYRLTEERTAGSISSLVSSVNQTVEGAIDNIDIVLQASAEEIGKQISDGKPHTQSISTYLEAQHNHLSHVGFLRATNDRGDLMYGKGVLSPPNNNADRDYFVRLKDNPKAGLFINKPVLGRVEKKWVWLFTRRINKSDGSFGGVVVAGINLDEIQKMLVQIPLGKGDTIAIRDEDHGLIARNDEGKPSLVKIGDSHLSEPFLEALKVNPEQGTFISDATAIDKISRTVAYLHNAKYGFTISGGLSREESLSGWRKQAWTIAVLVLAFIFAAVAYARLTIRTWLRHENHLRLVESNELSLREAKEAAIQSGFLSDQALELAQAGYWCVDFSEGNEYYISSERTAAIFGDPPRDNMRYHIMNDWYVNIEAADKAAAEATLANYLAAIEGRVPRYNMIHPYKRPSDGRIIWIHVLGQIIRDEQGKPTNVYGVVMDITNYKQAESKLAESENRLRAIINNEPECIKILDAQGCLIQMNPAGLAMIEADSLEQVKGASVLNIIAPKHRLAFGKMLKRVIAGKTAQMEFEIIGLKGGRRWLETHSVPMEDNGTTVLLGVTRDITERKEHEKQLEHIAHYDALTNLPNRVLLADRLHQAMTQAQRRGKLLAVAYIDLDGFKAINDSHGHQTGDKLLVALATRMRQAQREGDTLARLGGDEFIAVLFDLENVEASVPLLTRLLEAAAEPVHVAKLNLQVSASLGVTFYPQAESVDADQLLRQADQAMYQAKLAGKNRYHIFDAEQDISIRGHHESLEHIRRALIASEFELYYQPKVNMRTGKVIGAEALIRWQHPEKGLLPPSVFLPVIEDHPLAIQIGEWVIDTALNQMELWHAAGLDIPVSVNVGARQLQQADFVAHLRESLSKHPEIKPSCLELEVLETSALEDVTRVSQVIETCRDAGVMFALDDFGTGYSSLTYLKRLPVSTLKIDQSFVRDMLDDPDDLAILEGVLSLATAFRREVIAEGVETLEQGATLLQLGCDIAQGYAIARPMPAHEMPNWAAAWRPDLSWDNISAISRDDLPILFASTEHRAWIVAIEAFLKEESKASPQLDHQQCRFGKWLNDNGLVRHGSHPAYLVIETLHKQVHALSAELIEMHDHGQCLEAITRLTELYKLRDALLTQLKMLMQDNR